MTPLRASDPHTLCPRPLPPLDPLAHSHIFFKKNMGIQYESYGIEKLFLRVFYFVRGLLYALFRPRS